MNYQEQLKELNQTALVEAINLIDEKGEKSDHTSDKCLKIKKDDLMYNLDSGRYLTELHYDKLVDNNGYQYWFSVLETEKFFEVIDHLIEIYKK